MLIIYIEIKIYKYISCSFDIDFIFRMLAARKLVAIMSQKKITSFFQTKRPLEDVASGQRSDGDEKKIVKKVKNSISDDLSVHIGSSWFDALSEEFSKDYFKKVCFSSK